MYYNFPHSIDWSWEAIVKVQAFLACSTSPHFTGEGKSTPPLPRIWLSRYYMLFPMVYKVT